MARGGAELELFDNDVVGLSRFDRAEGQLVTANSTFARMFGFETLDDCLRGFPRPATHDERVISVESDRDTITVQPSSTRWLKVTRRLRSSQLVDLVVTDGTAEVTALASVSESESRIRALVHGGFEALTLSIGGVIVEANEATLDILGRPREEVIGRSALDFVAPEHVEEVRTNILQGREGPYESVGVRADGSRFPVEVQGRNTVVNGRRGRVTSYRDLTRQRQIEQELRQGEARYRDLANLLPVIVAELDERGRVVFLNDTGLRQLGYKESEILGRPVLDLATERDRARMAERLRARLGGNTFESQEYDIIRADGSVVPVVVHAAPIKKDGGVVGIRAALVDVRERRRAELERRTLEARTQESRRLESLFLLAGRVAHDFNNVLVGILGNASLAASELPEGSPVEPILRSIQESTARATELTRQLLAFAGRAQPSSGRTEPVSALLAERGNFELLVRPGTKLELQLPERLPEVRCDGTTWAQIVEALLSNASEAGARTVTVRLALLEPDQKPVSRLGPDPDGRPSAFTIAGEPEPGRASVMLEVVDDGPGITQDALSKIFEPLLGPRRSGRGLALGAILGAVRSQGGALAIESRVGAGTIACVCLPVASETPRARSESSAARRSLGGRALLIDDDPLSLGVVKRMMTHLGFDAVTASSGFEGLALLANDPLICLVVLDMNMPELSGARVLDLLRSTHAELPVLLSSGYDARDAEALIARSGGNVGFIQKPYRLGELESAVRSVLA